MILMVEVIVDLSRLDKFGPKMPEIRKESLKLIALDMQRTVDKLSPIDEGLLHKWFIAELGEDHATIKSPAKYVGFVNYGTSAHMIRPVNAKALHWTESTTISSGGVTMTGKKGAFSKGHMVRGIAGRHFIEKAITQVNQRTDDHFKTAIASVLK